MALSKEIIGISLLDRSHLVTNSRTIKLSSKQSRLFFGSPPSTRRNNGTVRSPAVVVAAIGEDIMKLVLGKPAEKFAVRASVTVRRKSKEDLKDAIANQLDAISDKIGRNVVLELVSNEIDHRTKTPRKSGEAVIKDWYEKKNIKGERVVYTAEFILDKNFGTPGAITVINRHQKEFFLESIVVEGFHSKQKVHFPCNSWVQSSKDLPTKRLFFTNKAYLPSETPLGLRELREKELKELRGDGKGIRKRTDRIYDYAIYNDLGNPDKGAEFMRPILGGEKIPYPRRCRTGRTPTDTNILCESRIEKPHPMYVPRDEAFEELKQDAFLSGRLKAVLHNLIPSLIASISSDSHDFLGFHDIDRLYKEGLLLKLGLQDHLLHKIPMVRKLQESSHGLLLYDTPSILSKDKFAWLRDDEFARQALAGINPVNIERIRVFPPVSKLNPEEYGPPESAITEDHIMGQLEGMTVHQAMEEGKLFMLDYHDIYLPFLDRIMAMHGRKAYGTRTIFYLTQLGTLKPVAIELSLPPTRPGSTRSSRVLTPPCDATTNWLWQLAKAHVCSNDAGVHQLVNHWLRTHAVMEPFILAAHRHLSMMHPVYKLLEPHMRYTLEINALARQSLINAEGVIEACFTPGPCCMEISAAYYRDYWRFDLEGLPADLIRRGMAVEDRSHPHGLRLLISDYPYANDGLLIWSAIQTYVESYVQIYYKNQITVQSDSELQSWYTESIHVGHADKRYASWWPQLSTPSDLVNILTTLIWLASAQHAALNFGQYPLGGYVPNRPPLMRKLVPDPDEDPAEFASFLSDPHKFFLSAMPGVLSATKFMAVVDTLSTHSPDEEYLGMRQLEDTWTDSEEAIEGFKEFKKKTASVEEEMHRRNADPDRRNRCGAGVLPYELLMPSSEPGVTGRGVPNSVSI